MQYWNNDATHYTPEVLAHLNESKPLAACIQCAGTGKWINPHNDADVRLCLRCGGTGDNRVKMPFQGKGGRFNPRRTPRTTPVPSPSPQPVPADDTVIDINDTVLDVSDDADDAETRLIEALRDLQSRKKQPLDEAAIRELIRDEIENAVLPQPLEIVVDGTVTGIVPALHHYTVPDMIRLAKAGRHMYLVGPAGAGKTTAIEQVAEALGRTCNIVGSIADVASDLTGYQDGMGTYHPTALYHRFKDGGILGLDEFDGSIDAAAPLRLNQALANGFMIFPNSPDPVPMHPDFLCIATGNTFGNGADENYIGRTQLDAATLDRFFYLVFDYDDKIEDAICPNAEWLAFVRKARKAVGKLGMNHVVTPRASKHGAQALAAGVSRETVERGCVWKGLTKADVDRVRAAMT